MYHIIAISDLLVQEVDSLAQWFCPGGPGSNLVRDAGFLFKLCIISYSRIFVFVRGYMCLSSPTWCNFLSYWYVGAFIDLNELFSNKLEKQYW